MKAGSEPALRAEVLTDVPQIDSILRRVWPSAAEPPHVRILVTKRKTRASEASVVIDDTTGVILVHDTTSYSHLKVALRTVLFLHRESPRQTFVHAAALRIDDRGIRLLGDSSQARARP